MAYTLQEPDIQQDPDKYSRCRHKYSMFFGGISQGNAMRIRKNNSVIVNYGGITGEHTDRWNIDFFLLRMAVLPVIGIWMDLGRIYISF